MINWGIPRKRKPKKNNPPIDRRGDKHAMGLAWQDFFEKNERK